MTRIRMCMYEELSGSELDFQGTATIPDAVQPVVSLQPILLETLESLSLFIFPPFCAKDLRYLLFSVGWPLFNIQRITE